MFSIFLIAYLQAAGLCSGCTTKVIFKLSSILLIQLQPIYKKSFGQFDLNILNIF